MPTRPLREVVPEIEPRPLVLPKNGGGWRMALEIPDFRPLVKRLPHLNARLASSRCVVFGTGRRMQAPGWLLAGPHVVPLSEWPSGDQVLLQVDPPDQEIDRLFRFSCLIRQSSEYLFKIGGDGTATEVRSKCVRPGQSYLVLKPGGGLPSGTHSIKTSVACTGLDGIQLELPANLTTAAQNYLDRLGLDPWQTISVYPVGLSPAAWDGAGWAEWLTTDTPLIGIKADGPVSEYGLQLDNENCFHFPVAAGVESIFLRLDPLSDGEHTLKVTTRGRGLEHSDHVGYLRFAIRAPRVRRGAYQSLFRLALDPPRPTFDDLWNNTVALELVGPSDRRVTPTVSLFGRSAETVLCSRTFPPLSLPVSAQQWRDFFAVNAISHSSFAEHTGEAVHCILHFDGGELVYFRAFL